jgi:hypothetical protein
MISTLAQSNPHGTVIMINKSSGVYFIMSCNSNSERVGTVSERLCAVAGFTIREL